jgi:hypothetical protein
LDNLKKLRKNDAFKVLYSFEDVYLRWKKVWRQGILIVWIIFFILIMIFTRTLFFMVIVNIVMMVIC